MSQTHDPRSTVVSIWYRAIGQGGSFKGSGAFISPRLVLTAKHVVKDEQADQIKLGFIPGQHEVSAKDIHLPETWDIAVLELSRDFLDQACVRLNCQSSHLEGKRVDLYGINPDTKCRDECQDYTLGTWNPQTNEYLFDHGQRKGFSGGIVVLDGYVIGVISKRHKSEQQGTMVPLYLAFDWLKERFPSLSNLIEPPDPPPIPSPSISVHTELVKKARQEISTLLKKQKLTSLRKCLLEQAKERQLNDNLPEDPAYLLVPEGVFSVEQSLEDLHQATQKCLEKLRDQDSDLVSAVISNAPDLLGWLVVLAVSETWLQEEAELAERLLNANHVAVPIKTKAGTEVVFSRLCSHAAKLELGDDGVSVFSPRQLAWPNLEMGIDQKDRLNEIKKLIWKAVMKTTVTGEFSQDHEDRLRERLAVRYGRGEGHYLIISHSADSAKTIDAVILNQLRNDLPHLVPFMIGTKSGNQVFVIGEFTLEALVGEFFLLLQRERA